MKFIASIFLHIFLIIFVMLAPVFIYEAMSNSGGMLRKFNFIGGITYFAYVGFWIQKIKKLNIKVLMWHLLTFLLLIPVVLFGIDLVHQDNEYTIMLFLLIPANILLPLVLSRISYAKQNPQMGRAHRMAFIALIFLGLPAMLFVAFALSHVNTRY